MNINITIQGAERLRAAFKKSPMIVRKHLDVAMEESAFQLEREIKPITPYRTGRLRTSIGDETREGVRQISPFRTEIGTTVEYAHFLEWGTRFMKARPYMSTGANKAMPEINRFFRQAAQNIAEEITK